VRRLIAVSVVDAQKIAEVATPVGDGWSYLWTGGGIAPVGQVAAVADRLVRLFG